MCKGVWVFFLRHGTLQPVRLYQKSSEGVDWYGDGRVLDVCVRKGSGRWERRWGWVRCADGERDGGWGWVRCADDERNLRNPARLCSTLNSSLTVPQYPPAQLMELMEVMGHRRRLPAPAPMLGSYRRACASDVV